MTKDFDIVMPLPKRKNVSEIKLINSNGFKETLL